MRTLLVLSLIPLVATATPARVPLRRELLAMGTRLVLRADGPRAAMEAALAESARIEGACSTWNAESEWSRLNATGGARLDAEWVVLLSEAKAWTKKTGGAFDPVLGRLVDSWGARRGGRVPGPEELQAAKLASGAAHLRVAGDRVELSGGAWIEEGGFLKGYALDRMKTKLEANGARSGLLDFGGQLLAWGKAVPVSVADPLDRQRPRFTFRLENASLSSSGTSERGRHILDPHSGEPCEPWGSVAVVMPRGFDADCLSTALFVMGPAQGLAWAEAHGVAAAFLPNQGRVRYSAAFKALHPFTFQEHR